jgi:hypothetical protein
VSGAQFSLTLKMEVIHSSETLVHIQTTHRCIPEDGDSHNYRCENLNSYSDSVMFSNSRFLASSKPSCCCLGYWNYGQFIITEQECKIY